MTEPSVAMSELAVLNSNQSTGYVPDAELHFSKGGVNAGRSLPTSSASEDFFLGFRPANIVIHKVDTAQPHALNIVNSLRSDGWNPWNDFVAEKPFASCVVDSICGRNRRKSFWLYRGADSSHNSTRFGYLIPDESRDYGQELLTSVIYRLNELSELLKEDGVALSRKSIEGLIRFLKDHSIKVRPSIAALDNGEVRALWKTADREQVAIHFKHSGDVNYVFFFLDDGVMKRDYKNSSISEATGMITSYKLWRLLGR